MQEIQMGREKGREVNGHYDRFLLDYDDDAVDRDAPERDHSPAISVSLLPVSSSPSISSSPSRIGYIEHSVSKFDTLAGVAIKYGVEVADIKKMNGLVTDLQMFALKALHIPLPGRHPTSPCFSNGSNTTGLSSSDHSPTDHLHRDLFESFQSLKMKSSQQQSYYGLKLQDKKTTSAGSEMAVHGKGVSNSSENGSSFGNPPLFDQSLSNHRKSRSLANGILDEILEQYDIAPVGEAREDDSDKRNDKLARRRQKSEANLRCKPDLLLKEANGSGTGFSSRAGKGLAQRQKTGSRTTLTSESVASGLNLLPTTLGDTFLTDEPSFVRKSSSTSNLQDQDNNNSLSIWPTSRWVLKPDLYGLPKPITVRRNKAAVD